MTLLEFKSWFEGFSEGIDNTPTEKQWKKIQAKVKDIDGTPITQKIFVDRYIPYPTFPYYYPPVWTVPNHPFTPTWTVYLGGVGIGVSSGVGNGTQSLQMGSHFDKCSIQSSFYSTTAMNQLGKYEAQN